MTSSNSSPSGPCLGDADFFTQCVDTTRADKLGPVRAVDAAMDVTATTLRLMLADGRWIELDENQFANA